MLSARTHAVQPAPVQTPTQQSTRGSQRFVDGVSYLQDPYDYDCDDNDSNDSNDASVDFYDAPEGAMSGTRLARDPLSLPSVRVNMDPQERLIEALEALREVVVENTNTKAAKMRPRPPPPRPKDGMKLGSPTSPKDERLKIRKSKVSVLSYP